MERIFRTVCGITAIAGAVGAIYYSLQGDKLSAIQCMLVIVISFHILKLNK